MPSVLLTESVVADLSATEPWPDDAKLYQPFEVEQILLPDNAACLSVKAFLRMCGLNFQVEMRTNAESMSPSGNVPFMKCGKFTVADVEPIINFVQTKGINLSSHLDDAEKADMKAYVSLVNIVLRNAELYVSWCDNSTLHEVTKPRFISSLPWPVNHILCWQTKHAIKKRLKSADWHSKSLEDVSLMDVYEMVDNCCHALSERLGAQKFFFGDKKNYLIISDSDYANLSDSFSDGISHQTEFLVILMLECFILHASLFEYEADTIRRPTELDAIVFGHLFAVLTTPLPDNRLCTILREYQNLVDLCQQIDINYFQKHAEEIEIENVVMES